MRWLCFLWIMLMGSTSHAYTGFGICNFGKETVSSVICYGPTVLNGTIISGDVKIAGPLKAYHVSMGSLTTTGTADVQYAKILGLVNVTGLLTAKHVDFQQGLTLISNNVTLSESSVRGSISMNSQTNKPYLKIECHSTVMGSVTFDGTAGIVQITEDSIVQGKIINGSLEFVKKKCSS